MNEEAIGAERESGEGEARVVDGEGEDVVDGVDDKEGGEGGGLSVCLRKRRASFLF